MFALDLFNTDHERRIAEGAVDQLEQRRIDDLAMKMDDLVARAKEPAYKKNPAALAALMKEFQKCKAERDGYYMIRNETMGYGSLGETGLPDVADKAAKMARLNQPGKVGTDAVTPQQRVNPNPDKGIIGHAADWLRGKGGPGKEGPTYESELDEGFGPVGSKALMNGNLATFMKARQTNTPVTLDIGGEQFRLTPAIMNAMAKKYNDDKAAADSDPNNKDIKLIAINNYRAFGHPDLMRKFIDAVATPEATPPAGEPGEQLPMFEKSQRLQKKKSNNEPELNSSSVRDTKLSRELTRARGAYPTASSDIEALVRQELDTSERVKQDVDAVQTTNTAQDQTLAQLQTVNQQQTAQIAGLEKQLSTIAQQAQQPARVAPAPQTTPTAQTPAATKSADIPIATDIPEPTTPRDQEIYNKVQSLEKELKDKIDAMASWNAIAANDPQSNNELVALRKEVDRTRKELQRQINKLTKANKEPTMVKPAPQTTALPDPNVVDVDAWEIPDMDTAQELEPIAARENTEKPTAIGQMAKNVGQGQELQKDPAYRSQVRRTQQQAAQRQQTIAQQKAGYGDDADEFGDIPDINEGAMKEIDIMRQDLERMSDRQFYTAYGISKAAFQQKYRTLLKPALDEHGGGIGPRQHWQDLMQETVADVKAGMAKIYRKLAPKIERHRDSFLAGQLYDELENYAELHGAEREFKQMINGARNRAHMEYDTNPGGFQNWFWFLPFEDNNVAEAISKKDLVGRLQKDLPKVTDPKNKDAQPVAWTGPGKDDYGYTGYQGHGMPTDKAERARIRADKKKGKSDLPKGKKGVAEAANVNPQFIDTQVTKILAGEARRMTNAPMAQLLAPVMKQYGLTLQQIDAMIPGGLKKAAASYGIMMKEGWSDAMVARRTGQPRTPYSVYIKGKKWKDFENDDHAEAVANKLRAKFKAEGRDPSVITIAPTNIPEDAATPPPEAPRPAIIAPAPAAKYMVKKPQAPTAKADVATSYPKVSPYSDDESTLKIYKPEQYREAKADPTGSWVVYSSNKVVKFKTHTGAKAYAEKTGGKVASGEFYADKVQKSGVTETALNPRDPQGDYEAKRRALHDLSLNKDVDQAAVRQRRLDLDREARAKGVKEGIVASGPSKPLDDRAVRKMVWDTMKINADTGEQAIQRALAVLAKKPQSRMVQDLQDKFQSLADRLEQGVAEGLMKEPANRKEYLDQRDKLFRMMSMETNPANKQIIKQAINDLQARYGNLKNAVKEEYNTGSEAVERAILNRIMVAHTDLLMKYGPDKVMQAAEEVAYNVGDVDEIGTSDVSAYVHQVKQILGVPEEVNEKWSQKYKSSINCANPKGFSQKAHCASKKK